MKKIKFQLQRIEDQGATDIAYVTVQTEREDINTGSEAMNALCRATARWVERTDEGKKMWDYAAETLNIGDIMGMESDEEFQTFLIAEGIVELTIESDPYDFEVLNDFVYDSVLPHKVDNFVDPQ